MTTVSWLAGAGGDWSDAADWSSGALPTATEDVLLATASAAVITHRSGADTVHSITATTDSLAISGGSLTVLASSSLARGLTLGYGGTFDVAGGTTQVSGGFSDESGSIALAAGAELRLAGTSSFGRAMYGGDAIDGPGTVVTSGQATVTPSNDSFQIGGGAVWANSGTVTDAGIITLGDTSGPSGFIRNEAGAVFDFASSSSSIQLGLHQDPVRGFEVPDLGVFANRGTIERTGDGGTTVIQARLVNRGTVNVASGTLALLGGGRIGGDIEGGGTLLLAGGQFVLDHPTVAPGTEFALGGGALDIAARRHVSGIALWGGEVNGPGTFDNAATIILGDVTFGGGVTFVNHGTAELAGQVYAGDTAGATATFVNAAGALFELGADALIGNATIYNPQTGQVSYGSSVFHNAGTLEVTSGAAYLEIDTRLLNTGSINLGDFALTLGGGGVLGGVVAGPGTLHLGQGTFALDGVRLTGGASMVLSGGTVALIAGQTFGGLGIGSGAVVGPGTLVESGLSDGVTLTLGDGATLLNTGAFTASGAIFIGATIGDTATIVNAAGALFDMSSTFGGIFENYFIDPVTGDYVYSSGTFRNAGTIALGPTLYEQATIVSFVDNTGIIDTSAETLRLFGGGTLGGTIDGGGTVDLIGGTFSLARLSLAADTHLVLYGGTIDVAAGSPPPPLTLLSGELDGAARYALTGTQTLTSLVAGGGLDLVNTGDLTLQGYLGIGDAAGAAVLDNLAQATIDLENESGINGTGGTIDNAGLLISDAGQFEHLIYDGVVNTGTVEARAGYLSFNQAISGSGSIRIEAAATLAASGLSNGQSLSFDGAGGTLWLNVLQSVTTPIAGLGAGDSIGFMLPTYADELGTTAAINGHVLTITPGDGSGALRFVSKADLSGDTAQVNAGGSGVTVTLAAAGETFAASGAAASLDGQTIAGFSAGAAIDVTDLAYTSLRLAFAGNVLSASDGARHADMQMPGGVGWGNLAASSDGHGGTLIAFVSSH